MQFADLERFLAPECDHEALVAWLAPLTEKERRALSGPLRTLTEMSNPPPRDGTATYLAVLGCVTGVRQVIDFISWRSPGAKALALASRVLADRKPAWLAGLGERLMSPSRPGSGDRRFVRQLVRDGLIATPVAPNYALCLPASVIENWHQPHDVVEALEADPGLVDELWELFATEGSGVALRTTDGYLTSPWALPGKPKPEATPERTWRQALVGLSATGRIDRQRLLDETLTAGLRDWKATDSGWFMQLHHALLPTIGETLARQSTYLRLLNAEPGPTVRLGQDQLRRLLDSGQVDLGGLCSASAAVLRRSDKGPVVAQLKLLERAGVLYFDQGAALAEAVATALDHDRIEIQEQARALIARLVPDAVSDAGSDVAQRVPPPEPAGPREVTPIEPVTPIADPDELAEVLGFLLEDASDPIEVERALEAGVRFAGVQPRGGGAVLVARAEAGLDGMFRQWSGQEFRSDLAAFTLSWLRRRSVDPAPPGRHMATDYPTMSMLQAGPENLAQIFNAATRRFESDWTLTSLVALRIREAAVAAAAAGGAQLLSLPTHRDGSLAPAVLASRIGALSRTARALPLDLGQAALRVAPGSGITLPAAHRVARALRQHLDTIAAHAPRWELVSGQSRGLYSSDIIECAVSWRDTAGMVGSAEDLVAGALDRTDPLRLLGLEARDGEFSQRFDFMTAMWPLMLPHHPELLAAHAHARLNRALTKNRNATEPLLDALARTRTRTGLVVCSALVMGASAKNGAERTRVVDALLEVAETGLLDGAALGEAIRVQLAAGAITGNRVAETLAEAARASNAVAGPFFDALSPLLPTLAGRRDAHLFIDLLAKLAIRLGRTVALPPEFAAIRDGKTRTSLAAAIRRLPT